MEAAVAPARKVTDKDQLVFLFRHQESYLPTEEKSYADGWHSGVIWKWDHLPGGPWTSKDRHSSDPEWMAYCDQTRKNNKAWMRGWFDGIIAGAENNENPWVKAELNNIIRRRDQGY